MELDRENKSVVHELPTKHQAASALLLGYTVIAADSLVAHHQLPSQRVLSVADPWFGEMFDG